MTIAFAALAVIVVFGVLWWNRYDRPFKGGNVIVFFVLLALIVYFKG